MARARLRVGLVGAGFMARAHTLAYRVATLFWPSAPDVELVRVVDVDGDRAACAARDYGWGEADTELGAVTDADDVDLVDIVTPNNAHEEPACRAAANGKALLCEKPLADTVESARRIATAVSEAGSFGAVSFIYRQWPSVVLARQLIARGEIGSLRRLSAWFLHDYAAPASEPMTWRLQRSVAGAGSVGDVGSHLIDLLQALGGPIARVQARTATYVPRRPVAAGSSEPVEIEVDDAADALLEFDSGAGGHLQTGWAAFGHKMEWGFEVQGEDGTLRFSWQQPNVLDVYRASSGEGGFSVVAVGPEQLPGEAMWPVAGQGHGWGDAFVLTIARVLRRLGGEAVEVPTVTDGLSAAQVVDALLRSAESRAWTEVMRV